MTERPAAPNRPRPWVAASLNLLFPPLGHVYAGAPRRGLAVLAAVLALATVAMAQLARPHGGTSQVVTLVVVLLAGLIPAVDAWRLARRGGGGGWRPAARRWLVYLAVAVLSVLADEGFRAVVRAHVLRAYKIPSRAMWPTLHVGDHILVDHLTYHWRGPARYEVVIFEPPGGNGRRFIKRVIGLPGEVLEIRDKRVYVNGEAVNERYVYFASGPSGTVPGRDDLAPTVIPESEYFVLSDNRDRSEDSREWGTVPGSAILGVVRSIYWSRDGDSGLRWDRMGKPVR